MVLQGLPEVNEYTEKLKDYFAFFDQELWEELTVLTAPDFVVGENGCVYTEKIPSRQVVLALNICVYGQREEVKNSIEKIKASYFFDEQNKDFYGKLYIYITDNSSELEEEDNEFIQIRHHKNTGGAGGFQNGIEMIRKAETGFTHVIFMDDDSEFCMESFYRLFALLSFLKPEYTDRPVAGRMFIKDRPHIQYSACEIWNKSDVGHVDFWRDFSTPFEKSVVNNASEGEYGGFWFCCYPIEYVDENDIMSFFIHCDDVEYALRCGKKPVILNGIQVWHELIQEKHDKWMVYYDTRNPLFVNDEFGWLEDGEKFFTDWKCKISKFHVEKDYKTEYYAIRGMRDYLRGVRWLYAVDSEKLHRRLITRKGSRVINAVLWRWTSVLYKMKR